MDVDPWVLLQPGARLRLLVSGVAVHHQVQLTLGVCARDLFKKRQELLVTMVSGLAGAGDLACSDLQRRERRGGAVALVVMGGPLRQPRCMGSIGAVRSSA